MPMDMTSVAVIAGTAAAPILWLSPLSDALSALTVLARSLLGDVPNPAARPASTRPRMLCLVPAFNEALLIERCIRSLRSQTQLHCEIDTVVLVDACTDDTAAVARCAGSRIADLGHTTPLGKARLLERAIACEVHDSYDAVVIVDADSVIDPHFCDIVAQEPELREIVQQGYHSLSNPRESWLTRLAALLNSVRYEGQLVLRARAGLNAPLTGNGMCIGREVLNAHGLAAETIKEDLELYARFTLAGVRIAFRPSAVVYAQEARTLSQARTQRLRWGAGKWHIVSVYAWKLLTSRLPLRQRIDALAEITHQGPMLHAFAAVALGVPLASAEGHSRWLGVALLASILPLALWTFVSLRRQPDPLRLVLALACLPAYLIWRLGVMLTGSLTSAGRRWQRSPRHAATPET